MKYHEKVTVQKNVKGGWRHRVGKKGRAIIAAGMVFAGLFAALPLQAKEIEEAAFDTYMQEQTLSENDVPDSSELSDEKPEKTPQKDDAGKTVQADPAEQPQKSEGHEAQQTIPPNRANEPLPEAAEPPVITAQPQNIRVEAGGYASFHVSATGENLTYQWLVDTGDGSGFQDVKGADQELYRVMVFDGSMNGYAYKCRVTSKRQISSDGVGKNSSTSDKKYVYNHTDTRAATLEIDYKIVGGARSVWVKSSGRGLVFQGSGAYSKFSGISVDGGRITAGEYNKGGSQTPFTEITLLRSYLETLAQGEHDLEIVWEDGMAETTFHIEAPASNLPAGASGLGRPGENGTGSSRAAGTTAAATDAANPASVQKKGMTPSVTRDENETEEEPAQISENTADVSVAGNTLKPSSGTAADVLGKAGVLADLQATPGERRTESLPSDFEKRPMRLAALSETVNRYAQTICLAVILISVAGIAGGFLIYRLHDAEGKKYESKEKRENKGEKRQSHMDTAGGHLSVFCSGIDVYHYRRY